jgi:hypothetical protein
MPGALTNLKVVAAVALIATSGLLFCGRAVGQVIAYTPQVGFVPNGSTLTATPVVSADRRYVRLTLSPFFNTLNGFTTYSAPIAAVGGFAGMNGGMGGGIGGGGAAGGGAAGGGIGQGIGGGQGVPMFFNPYMMGGYGYPTAYSPFPGVARGPIPWPGDPAGMAEPWPSDQPVLSGIHEGPTFRATRPVRGQRKAPRHSNTAARRRQPSKTGASGPVSARQP